MKATLEVQLDSSIAADADALAQRKGLSLSGLVEDLLRTAVAEASRSAAGLPVCSRTGGLQPGVDITNVSRTLSQLDEWDEADRRQHPDQRLP
jgi:hypothetical protein